MTKKEIQDKNIATSNLDNKNPALEGNFSNKNIEESIKKPAEGGYEENKKDEFCFALHILQLCVKKLRLSSRGRLPEGDFRRSRYFRFVSSYF